MGFSITYKTLFEVKILHDFLLNKGLTSFAGLPINEQDEILKRYNIHDYIEIEPTAECRRIMANYKLKVRKTPFGFIVGVKIDERVNNGTTTSWPFIDFSTFLSLTFSVSIVDPNFINFTNINQSLSGDHIYYLSNIKTASVGLYPSLSSSIPRFSRDVDYMPGDLIIRSNRLYESLLEIPSGSNFRSTQWMELDTKSYFHFNDRIKVANGGYTYKFKDSNITMANIVIVNAKEEVVFEVSLEESLPMEQYSIPLQGFTQGTHKLLVEGNGGYSDEEQFIWHREFITKKPFAVIEIAQLPAEQADEYELLNPADGSIRPDEDVRLFEICFKNRSSYWCYIFKEPQTSISSEFIALDSSNTKFVHRDIKQFTKFPIQVDLEDGGDKQLPNPIAGSIVPLRGAYPLPEESLKIYSEIYI